MNLLASQLERECVPIIAYPKYALHLQMNRASKSITLTKSSVFYVTLLIWSFVILQCYTSSELLSIHSSSEEQLLNDTVDVIKAICPTIMYQASTDDTGPAQDTGPPTTAQGASNSLKDKQVSSIRFSTSHHPTRCGVLA